MSKNNAKMVQRKMADQKQKFGIRKLSVGVASVLLGTVFYMQGSTVHADVNPTMSVGNDTANVINENSGISSSAVTLSTSNSTSSANSASLVVSVSDVTNSVATSQTSASSVDSAAGQVSNAASVVSDQGSATSASQVNAGVDNLIGSDNTSVTSSLASVQNNQVSVSAENASNEQARSNSLLSLNQSSNVKPSFLAVSKVVSIGTSNNVVNGGFDQSTWGTKVSEYQANHTDEMVTPTVPLDQLTKLVDLANAKFTVAKRTLPELDTNDAFALDPVNGLHEHKNVNDNGGYDTNFWGTLDVSKFTTVRNGDNLEITGYTGDASKVIIPNIADFWANGLDQGAKQVTISSSVMHNLAKNATQIGLSKTNNQKVVAGDAIWQDAFGGMTNESNTNSNANGGMWLYNPNLTVMDLHNLDTTNIINMGSMFNDGRNLKVIGDLDNWNTSNVIDMSYMFNQASKLANLGDLSKWDTSKVTNMSTMFQRASSLTNIGNLDNWNTFKVTDMNRMFNQAFALTSIGDLSKWDVSNVTDMHSMFQLASSLTNIGDLDNWNTSNVTDMSYMFNQASKLANVGDLSKWDTAKVTDMSTMFQLVSSLTNIGDLDNWDTSNVTDMSYMFSDASKLTNIGDLSKWDVSNVITMRAMFQLASSLTSIGDLDNWNTSKVIDMSHMFSKASKLQNLGNLDDWNTSKVTDMSYMFNRASALTNVGDLSKWDTAKVTDMSVMFYGMTALKQLNISNWNLTKLTDKGAFQFFVTGDSNLVVIANNVQLPTWYQNELSNSNSYWNDHLAVITNNETLLKATGSVDNVTVDDASVTRSVFYNSNGSDDAVSVLKQANQAYVKQYQSKHPGYSLTLALDVDQTDPIALANSKFISSKIPQTFKINFVDDTNGQIVASSSVEHVLVDTTLTLDTKELIKLIPEHYYFTDANYSIPTSFNYQHVTDNLTIHLTKAPVYTFNLVDDTLGKTASTLVWDGIDSNYHLTGTVSDLNQKIKQAVNAVEWKNVPAGAQHGDVPKSANLLTAVTDLTTLPTQDTTQTVHFVHATHSINEAHDVSQVIHYVYQNGSKALDDHVDSVHFVRDGYHDEFDNTDHWNSWTPSATYDFVAVQSPKIQGFTPDIQTVDKAIVNPSSQNIEQTVTYNPDAQKAVVKYIDDTDQKQLSVEDLTGHSDGDSGYNTKALIDQYLAKHYVLVSDDTHGQNVIYDHNDNTNQVYEVHFKHGTEPVSESRTNNLIVHYVYADGLARSGRALTDQKSQSLTFKRTGTKDLVTNNIAWNAWDHAGQTFDEIKSPIIDGYTPDQASIKDVQVNADGLELTEKTVVYNADSQKLMVNFIDDVTGKTLETINKVGQSDESANYDTKSDISKYIAQHYDLVSDDTKGSNLVFDHDDSTDQVYNVHLTHTYQKVDDHKSVNETVHYVYDNGQMARPDYKAPAINFSRTGTKDLVTNVIVWGAWIPASQDFKAVDSPVIDGYMPSQKTISNITVKSGDKDIDQTVVYVPDTQSIVVNYIDDVIGKTLKTDTLTGKSDRVSDYTTKNNIDGYENQHYVLVSDDTQGKTLTFDHDDKATQVYNVHLSHQTEPASQSRTVHETINYVYADGSKAADTVTVKPLTFTQTGVKDLVTGNIDWNGPWTSKQVFAEVKSPEITGYTASRKVVDPITVDHDSSDIYQTVIYTANDQTAKIKYIDDTTGKTLGTEAVSGKFGDQINFGHDVDMQIKAFEGQGYEFKSNSFNGQKYQADNSKNQFEVHFIHGTQNVSRTNKVTETVKYQFADGRQAQKDHVQTVEFTQHGVQDLVTKTTDWEPSDPQAFVSVDTPNITGYTADVQNVPAVTVNFGDADITKVVTYKADDQLAGIKYIDDTTGKTIDTEAASGKFGTKIEFMDDPSSMIQKFEGQGYKLVSNSFEDQDYQADNSKNHFEVHFKHDMKNVSRTSTITRTINYVDQKTGKEVHQPVIQTLTFTQNGVTDLVTGKTTWDTPSDQQFVKVESPKIDGYENPDILVVDAGTVKFGDGDQTVTVHYQKVETPATFDTSKALSNSSTPSAPTTQTKLNISTMPMHTPTQVGSQNVSGQQISNNRGESQLPQTGNQDSHQAGLVGLVSVIFAGLLGLGKRRKKNN